MSRLKKYEIKISVSILEGTNTRASGIRGYFSQLLKFQVFWCIVSMLKELYCIIETPLEKLEFQMWFVRWDLVFPRE